tara:strand:+ start:697 stop:1485 length:789 start_codon:yes stop_codon:yes gene_type:complete
MNLLMIIVLLLLVIIAVLVYRWYIAKIKIIVNEWDSNDIKDIEPVTTKKLDLGDSTNYTFSIWIYMTKWNVSSKPKYLIQRLDSEDVTQTGIVDMKTASDADKKSVLYHLELGDTNNDLTCMVQYDTKDSTASTTVHAFAKCKVEKIPIQRWVNVITTIRNRFIDMYIDGKLYKHCIMENPANTSKKSAIIVLGTKETGDKHYLNGRVSKLEYIDDFITPQKAWDIYVSGPRSMSIWGTFLNRYMLRIQWLKDGKVKKKFEI